MGAAELAGAVLPTHCDVCGHRITHVFYDAKLREGWWGLVCQQCFERFGYGLGVGRGQRHDAKIGTQRGG